MAISPQLEKVIQIVRTCVEKAQALGTIELKSDG